MKSGRFVLSLLREWGSPDAAMSSVADYCYGKHGSEQQEVHVTTHTYIYKILTHSA